MKRRLFEFLKSPSLVYLGASVIGRLGSMFLIPLYTRKLTPTEFATVSLGGTLQSLFALVLSGGLTAGLTKVFFDTPTDEVPEARVGVVARWLIGIVTTSATVLIGLISIFWPSGSWGFTTYQLSLIVLTGGGLAIYSIPDVWYRARRQAWGSASLNLASFVLNVGTAWVLVVSLNRGLDGVLEAATLSALCVGLWGGGFTVLKLRPKGAQKRSNVSVLTVFRFSFPFVPHFLASWVFSVGDRWALVSIGQRETLGLYSIGQQLASPLPMVASAVNEVDVAVMGEAFRANGAEVLRTELVRGLKRYLAVVSVPAIGLVLVIPILRLLLGPGFHQGLQLLPFVALACVIDSAYYPPVNVLFYASRTRWIPVVTVVSAAFSIAASAGMTALFGLPGLIVARLASAVFRVGLCVGLARVALTKSASPAPTGE